MPELPEVETVVRGLRAPLIGRSIAGVWYDWAKVIKTPSAEDFKARITGQSFRAITRRAKWIIFELDHDLMLVHLRMTGRLYTLPRGAENPDKWVHLRFELDNGEDLNFSDARRFGRAYLTTDLVSVIGELGPEPLEDAFTADVLRQRIGGRRAAIKPLLMDQKNIAGIGNIYADEALYRAGLHPLRHTATLTDQDWVNLRQAIRDVLNAGIDHEGASINWYRKPDGERGESQEYFNVYGRDKQPCRKCGTLISKVRVAQRGTHFCANCQPEQSV